MISFRSGLAGLAAVVAPALAALATFTVLAIVSVGPAAGIGDGGADGRFERRDSFHFTLYQDVDLDETSGLHGSRQFEQDVLRELEAAYERLDRWDEAADAYRSILERNPVSAANYGLAEIVLQRGDTSEGRRLLEEVVSKQTGLPRYLRRQERPWVAKAKKRLRSLSN